MLIDSAKKNLGLEEESSQGHKQKAMDAVHMAHPTVPPINYFHLGMSNRLTLSVVVFYLIK